MTYAILLISPGRWQQAKTEQPIGVVGLVIIHVSATDTDIAGKIVVTSVSRHSRPLGLVHFLWKIMPPKTKKLCLIKGQSELNLH